MYSGGPLRIAFINKDNEKFDFINNSGHENRFPDGFEWAEKAVDDLNRGIRRLESCEVDVFGKRRLIDLLRQEGVALHIYEPEKKRDRKDWQDDVMADIPRRAEVVPTAHRDRLAIGINADCLRDPNDAAPSETGRNAAFTLGYGVGKYINLDDKHSLNPLFDLAVRMDNVLVHHDTHDVPPTSLVNLLRHKKDIDITSDAVENPPAEMLAGMLGAMMSERKGYSVKNRDWNRPEINGVFSPMLEKYIRGPFALDVIYRTLKTPTEDQYYAHSALLKKLDDRYAGMSAEEYNAIIHFIDKTSVSKYQANKSDLVLYSDLLSHAMRNQDESLLLAAEGTSRIHRN